MSDRMTETQGMREPPFRLALSLTADAEALTLDELESFFGQHDSTPKPRLTRDDPALHVELHPAAEALTLVLEDGVLRISGRTGTVGPGYHDDLATLTDTLADRFGLRYRDRGSSADDTGYLRDRDPLALEAAFLSHLASAAQTLAARAAEGQRGFAFALPVDHRFTHRGLVATPVGPRDGAFVRSVVEDPAVGAELLPWWSLGRGADFYRGLALNLMWTEVRWREPLDQGERALLDEVATYVERAHGLDPELPLPWTAQSEIFVLLGEESLRATRAHLKAQSTTGDPTVGYRRSEVQVALSGGFWITIPGELAERWDERGTWVAWDATRSVWFTSMRVEKAPGEPPEDAHETLRLLPELGEGEAFSFERRGLVAVVSFSESTSEAGVEYRAEAHAAYGENAAVGTLVFTDPDDRDFVLETWGSLEFRAAR